MLFFHSKFCITSTYLNHSSINLLKLLIIEIKYYSKNGLYLYFKYFTHTFTVKISFGFLCMHKKNHRF